MNLGCFFVFNLVSHLIFDLRLAQATGEKHSKICITRMAAANATWNKIPMFVIGKSKSPRCFKRVKHLPCRYRNQNKSWVDSVLFEEWIREMDKKFTKEKKKVALTAKHIRRSIMDQGVIRSFKAYYKALALQRLVVAVDKGKDLPVFSNFRCNENARSCMEKSENFHYRQLFCESRNFERLTEICPVG